MYTARFKGEKTGHFTKTSGLLRDGYERLDAMRIFKVPFPGELRDCRLGVKPTNTHQESAMRVRARKKGRNKGWEAMKWFNRLVGKSNQVKKRLHTLLLKSLGQYIHIFASKYIFP